MPLDPVVQTLLEQLAAAGGPVMTEMEPPEARAFFEQFAGAPKLQIAACNLESVIRLTNDFQTLARQL